MKKDTTMIRLREMAMARRDPAQDERGVAMLTAILFMIIMSGIATIILGVVLAQVTPSYIAQKSTKTIYSAQAGLQAALGIFRSVSTTDVSGNTFGDPSRLPCSISATSVNAQSDNNTYAVTIAYYSADPTGQSASWLSANQVSCSAVQSGTTSAKYALLTSVGQAPTIPGSSASTGQRTLAAIYKFKVSNVNVPGGIIYNRNQSACMQAVTATAGSLVTFVAAASCSSTGTNAALQLWSYTTNYQITLASTTVGGAAGLCITGPAAAGQATQNATLVACKSASDAGRWNQLWSWTGAYTWEGENQAITGPNSSSWLSPSVADGTSPVGYYLQVSTSVNGTMGPTSLVGAGGASHTTHQLVNYLEFGRCADVTSENISSTAMISYPCKQDPTGSTTNITWNQKWYYCEPSDATGNCAGVNPLAQQVYVYYLDNTSSKYCLTTPTTASGSIFTTFQACASSGALKTQQTWSRVYNSGTYLTSYLITDSNGRCLSVDPTHLYATGISEQTVATCNGSDAQKWNAPPTYVDSTVGGYREVPSS